MCRARCVCVISNTCIRVTDQPKPKARRQSAPHPAAACPTHLPHLSFRFLSGQLPSGFRPRPAVQTANGAWNELCMKSLREGQDIIYERPPKRGSRAREHFHFALAHGRRLATTQRQGSGTGANVASLFVCCDGTSGGIPGQYQAISVYIFLGSCAWVS